MAEMTPVQESGDQHEILEKRRRVASTDGSSDDNPSVGEPGLMPFEKVKSFYLKLYEETEKKFGHIVTEDVRRKDLLFWILALAENKAYYFDYKFAEQKHIVSKIDNFRRLSEPRLTNWKHFLQIFHVPVTSGRDTDEHNIRLHEWDNALWFAPTKLQNFCFKSSNRIETYSDLKHELERFCKGRCKEAVGGVIYLNGHGSVGVVKGIKIQYAGLENRIREIKKILQNSPEVIEKVKVTYQCDPVQMEQFYEKLTPTEWQNALKDKKIYSDMVVDACHVVGFEFITALHSRNKSFPLYSCIENVKPSDIEYEDEERETVISWDTIIRIIEGYMSDIMDKGNLYPFALFLYWAGCGEIPRQSEMPNFRVDSLTKDGCGDTFSQTQPYRGRAYHIHWNLTDHMEAFFNVISKDNEFSKIFEFVKKNIVPETDVNISEAEEQCDT